MKYLVQAILIDGDYETPIDSFKTNNYLETLAFTMKRHKSSTSYIYTVTTIATKKTIIRTTENVYQ